MLAGLVWTAALATPLPGRAQAAPPDQEQSQRQPQETTATSPEGYLLLFRAEQIQREGDVLTCVGKVHIEYEGVSLDCQWLRYDLKTGLVEARKECLFVFGDSFAAAEEIDYLVNDRRAVLRHVVGRGNDLASSAEFTEQPLFFWADEMVWEPDKVELLEASVTTCDAQPGEWDYRIVARRVEIFPQRRLDAYQAGLEFGGFRPLTLPKMSFSLDPAQPLLQDTAPSLGFSQIFGAFARFVVPYTLDRHNYGKIHVDYYTRTGLAGGLEHSYQLGDRLTGDIFYYQQSGAGSAAGRYDFSTNARYKIDDVTTASVNYTQNRFQLPGYVSPLTVNTLFEVVRKEEGRLAMIQSNYARSADNTDATYQALLRQDLGKDTRLLVEGDYTQAANIVRETHRFHGLGQLTHRTDLFNLEADLEGASGTSTFWVDRLPELRMAARPIYFGDVPLLASFSYANLHEMPTDISANRLDMRLTVPDQMYTLGSSRLLVGAQLRQFVYDTGDDQRAWLARASLYQPVGDSMTARVDYNLQDPNGRTPFQHDLVDPYNKLTGGLDYYNSGSLRLGAYGGYDFYRNRPADLIGRMDYNPGSSFSLSSGANFDPNQANFHSVDNLLSFKIGEKFSLTHWSLYDFQQEKLTYQDVMLNYEGHDFVASVAYRGLQQELFFQFNLRGFPSPPVHVGPDPTLPALPNQLSNPFTR